ncbi:MAG: hypothetical protein R3B47_12680 [Bacteroidia bacterium]
MWRKTWLAVDGISKVDISVTEEIEIAVREIDARSSADSMCAMSAMQIWNSPVEPSKPRMKNS